MFEREAIPSGSASEIAFRPTDHAWKQEQNPAPAGESLDPQINPPPMSHGRNSSTRMDEEKQNKSNRILTKRRPTKQRGGGAGSAAA